MSPTTLIIRNTLTLAAIVFSAMVVLVSMGEHGTIQFLLCCIFYQLVRIEDWLSFGITPEPIPSDEEAERVSEQPVPPPIQSRLRNREEAA